MYMFVSSAPLIYKYIAKLHILYYQKYSLTCLDAHMNLSDTSFIILRV